VAEELAIRLIDMKYNLLVFISACVLITGCGQIRRVCNLLHTRPILRKTTACAKTEFAHPTKLKTPPAERSKAPLLLEDGPLLLDDGPQAAQPSGPQADNSRCFVCHINYMQEDIAVSHARADIGCAGCHGQSDEHIADESWASGGNGTAPEIMYPSAKINPSCMVCHTKDKLDNDRHKSLFANLEKMVCTDCHGSHRLEVRKCKWK
jgi:hypothetical protein